MQRDTFSGIIWLAQLRSTVTDTGMIDAKPTAVEKIDKTPKLEMGDKIALTGDDKFFWG